jgi:hypothetical protein
MRLGLINAESYSPLDLLHVWSQIASAMGDKVPAAFNCEDFLVALFEANDIHAHIVLNQAQREAETLSLRNPNQTPIDFTADTAGQLWGLSFTHEKGEESIFATTITLLCTGIAPEDQPPLRAVVANQLWIDASPPSSQLEIKPPIRIAEVDKLLELLNSGLLEDDQNITESSLTPEGSIELLQLATLPYVQPLIKFLEGKLSQ